MAASSSGWGAGAALLRPPTERVLRLSDAEVRIAVCERLSVDVCPRSVCPHVSQAGRVCGRATRGGAHAHCCGGTAGVRTAQRHNPLVREFASMLTSAGRNVAVEQRDPSMGPNARLDIVEYTSLRMVVDQGPTMLASLPRFAMTQAFARPAPRSLDWPQKCGTPTSLTNSTGSVLLALVWSRSSRRSAGGGTTRCLVW